MTTQPKFAAIAVASSAVLFFGNTPFAMGPTYMHYLPSYEVIEQASAPMLAPEPDTELAPPTPHKPKPFVPEQKFKKLKKPKAIATKLKQVAYSGYSQSVAAAPSFGSSAGNTYTWGQCTWYAKNKRPDLPNSLGNGGQWVANAAALGFATGSKPRAGAIGEQPGHVVYVESVNKNGTVNISEMNYNGGIGKVHTRTVAASTFKYIY